MCCDSLFLPSINIIVTGPRKRKRLLGVPCWTLSMDAPWAVALAQANSASDVLSALAQPQPKIWRDPFLPTFLTFMTSVTPEAPLSVRL